MNPARDRGRFRREYIVETVVLGLMASTTYLVASNYGAFASYVSPNANEDSSYQEMMSRMHNQTISLPKTGDPIFDNAAEEVIPTGGFQSRISLGDSVMQLVRHGVLDPKKFEAAFPQSTFPSGLQDVFTKPMNEPILLTRQNARVYENLLWPIGISNHMHANNESPLNSSGLYNFSSTGGWTFGTEKNGGAYFNKVRIANLSLEEEATVVAIAQNTYRPCCDNPTFFQDCNHGSALLGLLELGASQGLSKDELYKEALAFNSFWFPQQYVLLAAHFETANNTSWANVNPELVLSKNFSSASGFAALK